MTPIAYQPEPSARADKAVQLAPIPWGKRDPELAKGVMQSMAATTPQPRIPFNPVNNRRLRAILIREGLAR